jgi:hypothetical protein
MSATQTAARETEPQLWLTWDLAGMRCFLPNSADSLVSITIAGLHDIYSVIS